MENIISRIQDGIRNITFITTIQIILMIGLTTYSFASNSKIQGFSAMKSQTHFVEQLPYMFLHYYLHSNILHLLTNGIALLFFGTAIERRIGSTKYLVFFLLHSLIEPLIMISLYSLHLYDGNTVIGMSGYIFALFMINYYQPH